MDHYFILIYEDSLSVEDQHLFVQRLNSLLPNEDEVNFVADFAPHIIPILNRNSTYVANINISNLEFMQCSWFEVHGVITHKNIFPASFESNTNCDPHVLDKDASLSISETVHGLADQLPQSGIYHFDVILSHVILENVDVSNHIDLAGALHRLYVWHHAVFSIVCQSIPQGDHFQDWSAIINAQIVSKLQKSLRSAVLWRGSLSLKDEDVSECEPLKGLQINLNAQKSAHWLTLKDALGVKSKHTPNNSAFILSPHIELLDECCISTIPPYLFSPIHFVLTTTGEDKEDSNTHKFLQYLNSNVEICLILRLRYGILKKPGSTAKSYITRQWKKAVTTGNINPPVCSLEADSEHVILIAHKHCHLSTALSVYLLNHPSQLNAKISHDILATNSKYNSQILKNISEKCSVAIKKLPYFKFREIFFTFLKMLPNCQMEILTDYIRDKAEKSPEEKVELTIQEVQAIFNSVQDFLHSQLKFEKGIPFKKHLAVDSGELDSWDWPERLHLLQKQIKADKAMRHESLAGLMPPQKKTIIATAKDMGKYFNENGEPSATRNSESLMVKTKPSYASYQVDDIQEHWPDVLSKKFHDVYYNCNDISEEQEILHAKMKDHLVVHETASTCCNAQFTPSYTVLPLPKNSRSHSSRSQSKASKLKISPTKERKMGERTKSVSAENSTLGKERKDPTNSQNLFNSRSYSLPLRRSPRKRPAAPPPVTSNKRKNLEKPVASKQEDLSERHRMKLREAVVIALEKHDIDLNHSMFKPCARKLFAVCKPFVKDIIGKGSTSSQMQRIAAAHAKQVVDFEMQKKA